MTIYKFFRPLLFLLGPEQAHQLVIYLLQIFYPPAVVAKKLQQQKKMPIKALGLEFPNPVGIAAGLDKNGDCMDNLFGLGVGFVEVGAVTPKPQAGNAKPRVFRLAAANALINRMGFNNLGVDHLIQQFKQRKLQGIVGVNIGKNRDTTIEEAVSDYLLSYRKLYPYASYVSINVSSPNTPGLRQLQRRENLAALLDNLKSEQKKLRAQQQRHVPLLLKICPDNNKELHQVVELIKKYQIEGIIAVNTTVRRDIVSNIPHSACNEVGGLSGKPLLPLAVDTIKVLRNQLGAEFPIIGVGGIQSPEDAQQLLNAGATLLQLYTGLIYQGPSLPQMILNTLSR